MAISKTLQTALNTVFKRIQKREVFETASTTDLKDKLDEAILIAAIGKCVELNVLINNRRLSKENGFLFLANLRGVAEDLIVLQFLAEMPNYGDSALNYLRNYGDSALNYLHLSTLGQS